MPVSTSPVVRQRWDRLHRRWLALTDAIDAYNVAIANRNYALARLRMAKVDALACELLDVLAQLRGRQPGSRARAS
jgi:hypothetical protein